MLSIAASASLFWGCNELLAPLDTGTEPTVDTPTPDNPNPRVIFPEILNSSEPRCLEPEVFAKAGAGPEAEAIPGSYIVVLNEGAGVEVLGDMKVFAKGNTLRTFKHALNGFAGQLSQSDVERLRNDSRVKSVEPDYVVKLDVRDQGEYAAGESVQSWGVAKVGGSRNGTGKVAWILDTGIDLYNSDLNVDRQRSRNFVSDGRADASDPNGHGTHVAGIIGAKENTTGITGVAPNARLVSVRVLNDTGAGSYSSMIAGIDYVAANGQPGDVMNMSLGGPASRALDEAVRRAANKGIKVVVAAGNESKNTAEVSPARLNHPGIYTVSAFDKRDAIAGFSNYGSAVDVAAPGVAIPSTRVGGGVVAMSGTSMATPHVAGLLLFGSLHANGYAMLDPDGCADPLAYR